MDSNNKRFIRGMMMSTEFCPVITDTETKKDYIIFEDYNKLMDLLNELDERMKAVENEKCNGCKYKECIELIHSLSK